MVSVANNATKKRDLEGTRILVVDDIPDNVDVAFRMLDGEGIEVLGATSGAFALDAVLRKQPDLVLLDIHMPGMDGFETCRRLRSIRGLEELPVIFLTAQNDEASVVEGFDVGGTDYVTKPFQKDALLARIHSHLQRARLPRIRDVEKREHLCNSPEVLEALSGTELFKGIKKEALQPLLPDLSWVTLSSGQRLIQQGQYNTAMYVLLSGRLHMSVSHNNGTEQTISEIGRGEVIGEISLFTDRAATANITAIRDSNLIQIPKDIFNRFKETHPVVLENINHVLIQHINNRNNKTPNEASEHMTIALVPTSADVPLTNFAKQLTQALEKHGSVMHLNAQLVNQHLGSNYAHTSNHGDTHRTCAAYLNDQEAKHKIVIYETDHTPSAWTSRCLRHADRVLIVGCSDANPTPGLIETDLNRLGSTIRQDLVLLHPPNTNQPTGTAAWLAPRNLTAHHHIRQNDATHMARVARILVGRAMGLVLSGGSTRGFAHIGVIRALQEHNIPIDLIGGSSCGASFAAQHARGQSCDEMLNLHAKWWIEKRAMYAYTLPLMSLAVDKKMNAASQDFCGQNNIEDLWINYFCVSTNLTKAELHIHRKGSLWEAARATAAVPAYFAPSYNNGDLLVDGGIINNLPVDIMRGLWECQIMASDVSAIGHMDAFTPDFQGLSGWQLLFNRLNPFAKKIKAPMMTEVIGRMIDVCSHQTRQNVNAEADFYFRPPVQKFSWFDPKPIREIAEVGYCHANKQISQWKQEQLISVL